jgi:hypothetical protein
MEQRCINVPLWLDSQDGLLGVPKANAWNNPYRVSQAHGPHRMIINHDGKTQIEWNSGASMPVRCWTHKMEFWVYPLVRLLHERAEPVG